MLLSEVRKRGGDEQGPKHSQKMISQNCVPLLLRGSIGERGAETRPESLNPFFETFDITTGHNKSDMS